MRWLEVQVDVPAEAAEAVAALLQEWPEVQGVALEGALEKEPLHPEYGEWFDDALLDSTTVMVTVYLPATVSEDEVRERIGRDMRRVSEAGLAVDDVAHSLRLRVADESEWENAWKQDFHPVPIGQRFLVTPRWERDADQGERIPIVLDPGMAFGTGTHQTTQMCLMALESIDVTGQDVVDVGCGTAILSIGAAKLGARSVTAIDIDPVAVEVASDNVRDNGVEHVVQVRQGDLLMGLELPVFDVLLANILQGPVIALVPHAARLLKPNGYFVASGFVASQSDKVAAAFEERGLTMVNRLQMDDWMAFVAVKTP